MNNAAYNDNFDRIESYLFGQMKTEEAKQFEQEAAKDEALSAALEQHRLEHRAMEMLLQQDLQANLNAWKAEKSEMQADGAPKAKVVSMSSTRTFYRIAAAACIVLTLGFVARSLFFSSSTDMRQLAMENFESNVPSARGQALNLEDIYEKMRKKQYQQALELLESRSSIADRATYLDLKGECLFGLANFTAAADAYAQLLQTPALAADLKENAEWKQALCYVAQDDQKEKSRELLEKIKAENGIFAPKASALLKNF